VSHSGDSQSPLPPPPAPAWSFRSPPSTTVVERLADELSLPREFCSVLAVRGLEDPDEAKRFLRPRLENLTSPERMRDLDLAAHLLLQAIEAGDRIFVHGDYDVDGVCSAALLTSWLRYLGGQVVPFVPHRTRDGYDLGPSGVRAAVEAGAKILLTCDSGIVAHEAVIEARAAGMKVIITDHHTPGSELPPAEAVVNPARADCDFPAPALCGAGVAFKLCQRLAGLRGIDPEELWPSLDLVALATIADLVPLQGENRVLVSFGLRYLSRTSRVGLKALLEVSGLRWGEELGAGEVGFVLAPRINAIGRMGDAGVALRLLLTHDEGEAADLAGELEEANRQRKDVDRRTLDEALGQLSSTYDPDRDFGVVLHGDGWHPGVIGIVASRVVERIHRPVVIVSVEGDTGRGSGRSIAGVHLLEALGECRSHLRRFGGHRQAAGFDIAPGDLAPFREAFNDAVRTQLAGEAPRPSVSGDVELSPVQVDDDLHRWLEYLGPFGMGNPRPVFHARNVPLRGPPRIVGGRHLAFAMQGGNGGLDAIGFGLADRIPPDALGHGAVDLLFQVRTNEYRGRRSLQARLVDVRPASSQPAS
jgi:single-stranded-DNA-specific exonuclease